MHDSEFMHYQKEDVLPYMRGMWREALQSICGLGSEVFNKKHQPCPHCGGKDRFRWTDKLEQDGDGGAVCNGCGSDTGIGWIMKLTGEPYSEAINILGRFLGKVPQEYRIRANKRASRSSGYNFGAQAPHENCLALLERTEFVDSTPLSRYEGIFLPDDQLYCVGVKPDGGMMHAIPCRLVHEDGLDDEMCNVMLIGDGGDVSFYAKDYTRGSVAVTGSTDKTIYLCVDWVEAQHIHIATGQEVWACFSPANLEIVAFRYKGDRNMRVVCKTTDRETLIAAEERNLDVMVPIDNNYKRGIERKLYKPETLL